jgi:hypothetical protein
LNLELVRAAAAWLLCLLVACSQVQVFFKHPEQWAQVLGAAIPQTSNFFLNYVITRAFMLNLVRLLMPRKDGLTALMLLCGMCAIGWLFWSGAAVQTAAGNHVPQRVVVDLLVQMVACGAGLGRCCSQASRASGGPVQSKHCLPGCKAKYMHQL